MKYLILLACLLSMNAMAQVFPVISLDAGSNVTSDSPNGHIALMAGVVNWKGDQVAVGPLIKQYQSSYSTGGRISVLLSLKQPFFFYTHADAFMGKFLNSSDYNRNELRLELGAGLGIRFLKGFQFSAGVQSSDYNIHTRYNSEGSVLSRLTYNYIFN